MVVGGYSAGKVYSRIGWLTITSPDTPVQSPLTKDCLLNPSILARPLGRTELLDVFDVSVLAKVGHALARGAR